MMTSRQGSLQVACLPIDSISVRINPTPVTKLSLGQCLPISGNASPYLATPPHIRQHLPISGKRLPISGRVVVRFSSSVSIPFFYSWQSRPNSQKTSNHVKSPKNLQSINSVLFLQLRLVTMKSKFFQFVYSVVTQLQRWNPSTPNIAVTISLIDNAGLLNTFHTLSFCKYLQCNLMWWSIIHKHFMCTRLRLQMCAPVVTVHNKLHQYVIT